MKKTITITVLGLLMILSAQSWAQEKGQIRVGLGLAMGTKAAVNDTGSEKLGMGINIGGDYFVIDKLAIAPSYTFFFKSSHSYIYLNGGGGGGSNVDVGLRVSSFNVDGKYYFLTEGINVYGLFGLSFATSNVSTNLLGTPIDVKGNKTGINIGGGVDYGLSDKLFLNGQVKYNTPLEQLVINVGVGYVIN